MKQPVTLAIVGLNAAVFVAMVLSGVSLTDPTVAQLLHWGANFGPDTLGTPGHGMQPWRLLTANYLHIGLMHVGVNMWSLWNLGNLAERIFSRWAYLAVYTLCGLAGSLASVWWHPMEVGAGASGAIFGLVGAVAAALYLGRLPIHPEGRRRILNNLVLVAAVNLIFGFQSPIIDNSAHIGGLVAGLALGGALAPQLTAPPETRRNWDSAVTVTAALLLAAAFVWVRHVVVFAP
jgi:rhomboid protease GluP